MVGAYVGVPPFPTIDKLPSVSELRSRQDPAAPSKQSRPLLLSFRSRLCLPLTPCCTVLQYRNRQPFEVSRLVNHSFLSVHRLRHDTQPSTYNAWEALTLCS